MRKSLNPDPFGGFYDNPIQLPIFRRSTVTVTHVDLLPSGCVTPDVLIALAQTLTKIQRFYRKQKGPKGGTPCLRLLQGARNGRISALVEQGETTLKLVLQTKTGEPEWIVLGDALKVVD